MPMLILKTACRYFSSFQSGRETTVCAFHAEPGSRAVTKLSRGPSYRNEDKTEEGSKGIRVTGHVVKVLPPEREGELPALFPLISPAEQQRAVMCVEKKEGKEFYEEKQTQSNNPRAEKSVRSD